MPYRRTWNGNSILTKLGRLRGGDDRPWTAVHIGTNGIQRPQRGGKPRRRHSRSLV